MDRQDKDAIAFVRQIVEQHIYRSKTCNRESASKAFYNMARDIDRVLTLAEKQLEYQDKQDKI